MWKLILFVALVSADQITNKYIATGNQNVSLSSPELCNFSISYDNGGIYCEDSHFCNYSITGLLCTTRYYITTVAECDNIAKLNTYEPQQSCNWFQRNSDILIVFGITLGIGIFIIVLMAILLIIRLVIIKVNKNINERTLLINKN